MNEHEKYDVELFDLANKVNVTSDCKSTKFTYEHCKYCDVDEQNFDEMPPELPKEIDSISEAYVYENGNLDIWTYNTFDITTFYINYCPMCGRKLG